MISACLQLLCMMERLKKARTIPRMRSDLHLLLKPPPKRWRLKSRREKTRDRECRMSESGTEEKVTRSHTRAAHDLSSVIRAGVLIDEGRGQFLRCVSEPLDSRVIISCARLCFLRTEFTWGQWTTQRRDERDSDFAPPSSYFLDERRAGRGRSTQEVRGKGKPGFKRSEAHGGWDQDGTERRAQNTHASFTDQSSFSQPQQTSRAHSAQTHDLDALLSFYKNSV